MIFVAAIDFREESDNKRRLCMYDERNKSLLKEYHFSIRKLPKNLSAVSDPVT